jgi:predicted amidophosphoribosyltransferase
MAYLINNSYQYLKSFDIIVAAPSSDMSRGFNQAGLLAQNISNRINIPFKDVLYKRCPSPPQKSTPFEKKEENVKDKYGCDEMFDDANIIIIDDICTTRSTMNSCAKVLKRCGAKEIRGFVAGRSTDVRNIKYIKQEEKYDIYQGRSQNG